MRIKNWFALLFTLVAVLFCPVVVYASFQSDYKAIDQAAKSMFLVEMYGADDKLIGTGSGFIAFDNHYFITNHHVIEDAAYLKIISDQEKYTHTLTDLIICDEFYDIAILDFPEGKQYNSLTLDPNFELFRGQPVTAIGSPQGILNTVSNGNISTFHYYRDGSFDIQFTAPISHGSSGGALFNEHGSVIGLVYATITDGEALNLAVPIQYVIDLYKNAPQTTQTLLSYNNLSATPPPTPTPTPKKTPAPKLTAPTGLVISLNKYSQPTLAWLAVPGATSYKIYRERFNGQHDLVGTIEVLSEETKLIFSDSNPYWGKENTYYVASSNASTYAKKSNAISIQVPQNPSTTPTPFPTSTPTRTPSPNPTLPEGIKDSYMPGVNGKDILTIKEKMQTLGYYRSNASLGSSYNDTMVDRVKLFQKNNRLPVTGILDHSTLLTLFSNNAIWTTEFGNAPTPAPTSEPYYIEPSFPLIFPNDSQMNGRYDNGNLKFRVQIENTSQKKTISEYEIYAYVEDASGEPLLGKNKVIDQTIKDTIPPGEKTYTEYISIPNVDNTKKIYIAVTKIIFNDGTLVSYPTMYPRYTQWLIN